MDTRISGFSEEYLDSLRDCFDSVARERRYLAFLEAPPPEEFRRYILENQLRGAVLYLALSGGAVVGWCDVVPHRMEGFTHTGKLGIGVRHDHRGMGVGARLMHAAIDQARIIGLQRIELDVFASNTRAAKLYRLMEFVEEGIRRHARKIDGVYDDIILMARLFPEADRR